MQQTNPRECKNQKAPRWAGLLEKYLYKSITYRLNGGEIAIRTRGRLRFPPLQYDSKHLFSQVLLFKINYLED